MADKIVSDAAMQSASRKMFLPFLEKGFQLIEPGKPFEFNWHIGCIAEHLEANYAREIPWLIINLPPRCLKSVEVAQLYPAWVLGQEPHHQFIGVSYGHSLAQRNVVNTRRIIQSKFYTETFPDTKISLDQNTKDYFTTTENGQYKGAGIGGDVTGFGCDTLIIDDPINPKEAASDTVRINANEEIRSTLFSRFNDRKNARLVMIMQRLHEGDPTGELLGKERYHLLKLPAEAKTSIHINLRGLEWKMEPGDMLTPRLTKQDLQELKEDLGEYNFVGQYLQEPVPVGGGEFKSGWPQYYQNGTISPKLMNICILVDPSGGEQMNKRKRKLTDFSAFMVVGLGPDNNYYLLDAVRDRLNPTERVDMLFLLHRKWNELSGRPPKVGYEKYGMQSDSHYIKEKMKKDMYHFKLVELGGKQMKEERIRALIPDMQMGRWYFPATMIYVDNEGRTFDLVKELIDSEMATFPKARFDDMLDALARVYDKDLAMVFPRPKAGSKKRGRRNRQQGWEEF